jgi:hypothetical protein
MKRTLFIVTLLIGTWTVSLPCAAEDPDAEVESGSFKYVKAGDMIIGGFIGFGITTQLGSGHMFAQDYLFYEDIASGETIDKDDRTAKFAGGGGVYFDYYFIPFWGVEAGLGFTTKGIRYKGTEDGLEWKAQVRHMYMELPVMVKLNYRHFQATAGLALSVALSGVQTLKEGDSKRSQRFQSDRWRYYNRVNLGPKLGAAYAIPVGPVFVVPGITWSFHFIDELNDDDIDHFAPAGDTRSLRYRSMNLMFNAGVEWDGLN